MAGNVVDSMQHVDGGDDTFVNDCRKQLHLMFQGCVEVCKDAADLDDVGMGMDDGAVVVVDVEVVEAGGGRTSLLQGGKKWLLLVVNSHSHLHLSLHFLVGMRQGSLLNTGLGSGRDNCLYQRWHWQSPTCHRPEFDGSCNRVDGVGLNSLK